MYIKLHAVKILYPTMQCVWLDLFRVTYLHGDVRKLELSAGLEMFAYKLMKPLVVLI